MFLGRAVSEADRCGSVHSENFGVFPELIAASSALFFEAAAAFKAREALAPAAAVGHGLLRRWRPSPEPARSAARRARGRLFDIGPRVVAESLPPPRASTMLHTPGTVVLCDGPIGESDADTHQSVAGE